MSPDGSCCHTDRPHQRAWRAGPSTGIAQTGTIYVNQAATGSGDGSSWANAYPSLQAALLAAASGAELWVAQGTYAPTTPNGIRTATFQLKNGVAIYERFGQHGRHQAVDGQAAGGAGGGDRAQRYPHCRSGPPLRIDDRRD
jgi:hypothetical protein